MKDILITARRQKIEIKIYLLCLLLSIGLNICAIVKYSDASWEELFTQLPRVFLISLAIYACFLFVRGLVYLIRVPFRKKTPTEN